MVLTIFWVLFLYVTATLLTAVVMYPAVQYEWQETGEQPSRWDPLIAIPLAIILGLGWPWHLVKLIRKIRDNVRSR